MSAPTTTATSTPASSHGRGFNGAAAAGIGAGSGVLVIAVGLLMLWLCRRKRKARKNKAASQTAPPTSVLNGGQPIQHNVGMASQYPPETKHQPAQQGYTTPMPPYNQQHHSHELEGAAGLGSQPPRDGYFAPAGRSPHLDAHSVHSQGSPQLNALGTPVLSPQMVSPRSPSPGSNWQQSQAVQHPFQLQPGQRGFEAELPADERFRSVPNPEGTKT